MAIISSISVYKNDSWVPYEIGVKAENISNPEDLIPNLQIPSVINDNNSNDTQNALSAYQGKLLQSKKIDKTGGTFTGDISFKTSNAGYTQIGLLSTSNTNANASHIRIYPDEGSDTYGNDVVIQGGGRLILGGGQSAEAIKSSVSLANESLTLGADDNVYVMTNCNTIANRKTFTFSNSGRLTAPNGLTVSAGGANITGGAQIASITTIHGLNIQSGNGTYDSSDGITHLLGGMAWGVFKPITTGNTKTVLGITDINSKLSSLTSTHYWSSNTTKSVSKDTNTPIASVKIPKAGIWLVTGWIRYASNSTGVRALGLTTRSTTWTSGSYALADDAVVGCQAVSGNWTQLRTLSIRKTTGAQTIYTYAYQESGAALGATSNIQIVQIGKWF